MKTILRKIAGLDALVIGDVMLDHYVWGDATRISPEAPVPVVEIFRDTYSAGGAANVAANIRTLGAGSELWGWLGDDESGGILRGILRRKGVTFRSDIFVSKAPTIQKTRVMVRHQQLCRLDREPEPSSCPRLAGRTIARLMKTVGSHDVVIFSDYAKGFLDDMIVAQVAAAARKAGVFMALDPKPRRPLNFKGLDLITPNRRESLQLSGIRSAPHEKFPAAGVCKAIWEKFRPRHLVITMGEEGMLLSEKGRVIRSIPTVAREVYDVSGAGDTIVAALSLALAAGAGLEESAHLANAAAGVVIGKVGTATATPEEILAYASQR